MVKRSTAVKAKAVLVDGPYPDQDRDGDEVPYWTVSLVDDDGDDLKTYTCTYHSQALSLGRTISRDRRIEFINESTGA